MPAPPDNDKPSTSPPVYCIPPVTARTDDGDSESDEDLSDNSEPFYEEPNTDPMPDVHLREHEPNSTGTKRARFFPDNPRGPLPSSKPNPHTRHQQTEPTRRHYHPYETHAPAWQNYEDDPSTDQYPFGNFGGAWYPGPFGSHPYGGQQVVPYNFNPFAPGGGTAPGPTPPMPTGPTQHPMNTGPGTHHGHGLPFTPSGGYSNMHPNHYPNQYPNQYPHQYPNEYPNQHPNSFQMPPPAYPGYPAIDGAAPPPAYNQPRVSMRHPSIRQDFRPSAPSPSPYGEHSQPYPRRTRGRREATPKDHEYQGLHPRPQPPHGRPPRHPRPSATASRFRPTERFDSDSEGPMLNKENLEKLEGAEAYMRAANEAGKRPGEKAREEDAKLEPKKEAENGEAQMGKKEKPRDTKEENDTGVVETRIKNMEDSLRQLVALHTTTAAGVPGIVQDPFRSLRDLESRQLMQQVSSLLGTLPGGLGVGYGPLAGPISPFGSLTPLINLQHLGSLLNPPFTPPSGHTSTDEPTTVYVQQLQQRIERLERDRDAPSAVKTELAGAQQQVVAGDTNNPSALEYLKLLTEGMQHLNARLGSSQENDEEVASTTTATTDSGTTFRSGRTRPRRRATATRESFVGDEAPDTTESRPGIIKPTQRRSASRASRSSKKAHFEDDISDQKDEDEHAYYTHRAPRPSSSPNRHHHARGQTTTTPPKNMNIKATRTGSGGIGSSSSYPPRNEDWSHYETDDGMAEKRGLKRTSTPYVVYGPAINDSTWKPVVPDPPPANM
ncbi:hypothetical protein V8F06_010998 [Rhypophila decipiens]